MHITEKFSIGRVHDHAFAAVVASMTDSLSLDQAKVMIKIIVRFSLNQ